MTDNSLNQADTAKPVEYKYLHNGLYTTLVTYSFVAFAVFTSIIPIMGAYALTVLEDALVHKADKAIQKLDYIASRLDTSAHISTITYIICAIIFLIWIFRASNNLHALNKQKKFVYTPAWCVGSFFIPILALYWPYKAMLEIWNTTIHESDKQYSILLPVWWITFILSGLAEATVTYLPLNTYKEAWFFIRVDTLSSALNIIAAVLAIKIVQEINKAQTRNYYESSNRQE